MHNWEESWGYILSSVLSVISLVSMMALIGFIRYWVKPNYLMIKESSMKKKIGSLYSGLNLKSKVEALTFTEWFIMRRLFYSGAAFAIDQSWLQF